MEEITLKRIFRWTLASLIVLIGIAYSFGVGIASADSGTITVETLTSYSPANLSTSGTANKTQPTYEWLFYQDNLFNTVTWLRFNQYTAFGGIVSYGYHPSSSGFSCISNATCSGIVYQDSVTQNWVWLFDDGSTFQRSPIRLQYNDPSVFSNASHAWGFTLQGVGAVSPTTPFYFRANCCNGTETYSMGNPTGTFSVRQSDSYTLDYPSIGDEQFLKFYMPKGNSFGTKYFLYNQTGGIRNYIFNESSFNTGANITQTKYYGGGLRINYTLASGGYTIVLLNGSAQNEPIYGYDINPNGSGIVNYSNAWVKFDYDNYYNNSDMRISYDLKFISNNTDFFNIQPNLNYFIEVIDPYGIVIHREDIAYDCFKVQVRPPWDTWNIYGYIVSLLGYEDIYSCTSNSGLTQPKAFFISPPYQNFSNGSYSVNLYESLFLNNTMLNTDSTNVYNYSGFQSGGTGVSGSNGITSTITTSSSNFGLDGLVVLIFGEKTPLTSFVFAVFFMIMGIYFGHKSKIQYGVLIGLVASFLLMIWISYIPMWVIIFIVIVLLVLTKIFR